MGLKSYFSGRSGRLFWLNVVAAVVLFIALLFAAFFSIDVYTRHGQSVEVPDVGQLSRSQAERTLRRAGLKMVVEDSLYEEQSLPDVVLGQRPAAGQQVKPGRVIAVTINRGSAPSIVLPDLTRNATIRIAQQQLKQLGFRLTEPEYVDDEPLDLVIGIRQGSRQLQAGDLISPAAPLTIQVGAGMQEEIDSLGLLVPTQLDSLGLEEETGDEEW